MRCLRLSGLLGLIVLLSRCSSPTSSGPAGPISASGDITSSATWSGEVTVSGPVTVKGGVLTIEPGTVVRIDTSLIIRPDTVNDTTIVMDTSRAGIAVQGQGSIQALGTAAKPIRFTPAGDTKAKGQWAGISLSMLANDAQTQFSYCLVEYAVTGISVGSAYDSLSWTEPTDLTVDHCVFRHMRGDGIYATNGGKVRVSNSAVYDCDRGFFFDGLDSVTVEYTFLFDVGAGIVLPGDNRTENKALINHVTIDSVNLAWLASPTDRWWGGYGLFPCNTRGEVSLFNTIINGCSRGTVSGAWALTDSTNCFFNNGFYGAAPGASSKALDPLFVDGPSRDLRLAAGSPCIGAAFDGTNIGAWQSGDLWWKGL